MSTRNLDIAEGTQVRLTLAEWAKLLTIVIGTVVTVTVSVAHSVGEIRESLIGLQATVLASQRAAEQDRHSLRNEVQYLRQRLDSLPHSAGSVPSGSSPPR